MTKLEFLRTIFETHSVFGLNVNILRNPDNFEVLHHYNHIVLSNLNNNFYFPIKNINLKNAADGGILYSNNIYDFIQYKTITNNSKFISVLDNNSLISRYETYSNFIEFGFLSQDNFYEHSHLKNKIDFSFYLEESSTEFENAVIENIDLYKKKYSLKNNLNQNNIYINDFYGKINNSNLHEFRS